MEKNKSSHAKFPLVSIVIPAYKAEYFISDSIKSIEKTQYPNFEVILVFDPSPDKGLAIAKKMLKNNRRWRIVVNKSRLGLASSLNIGIRKAKGNLIAFMVCDMDVEAGWLSELVDYLVNADPSVGVAIAKIYDFHKRDRLQVYSMYLMPQTGWVVTPEFGLKDRAEFKKPFVGYCGAEAMLVRKQVFATTGLFDEDINILIHDLDMIWRIWLAGFKTVRVPTSKVYHWSLKEGRINATWEFFYARMIVVFIQNYSFESLIVYFPQFISIYFIRAILALFKGNTDPFVGFAEAICWTGQKFPEILEKRKFIQKEIRKVSDTDLRQTIFYNKSLLSFYLYMRKMQQKSAPIILTEESKKEDIHVL